MFKRTWLYRTISSCIDAIVNAFVTVFLIGAVLTGLLTTSHKSDLMPLSDYEPHGDEAPHLGDCIDLKEVIVFLAALILVIGMSAARVAGATNIFYKDAAHMLVASLITAAICRKCWFWATLAIVFSVVEIVCATLTRGFGIIL